MNSLNWKVHLEALKTLLLTELLIVKHGAQRAIPRIHMSSTFGFYFFKKKFQKLKAFLNETLQTYFQDPIININTF